MTKHRDVSEGIREPFWSSVFLTFRYTVTQFFASISWWITTKSMYFCTEMCWSCWIVLTYAISVFKQEFSLGLVQDDMSTFLICIGFWNYENKVKVNGADISKSSRPDFQHCFQTFIKIDLNFVTAKIGPLSSYPSFLFVALFPPSFTCLRNKVWCYFEKVGERVISVGYHAPGFTSSGQGKMKF